jgi:hypothetical protein
VIELSQQLVEHDRVSELDVSIAEACTDIIHTIVAGAMFDDP